MSCLCALLALAFVSLATLDMTDLFAHLLQSLQVFRNVYVEYSCCNAEKETKKISEPRMGGA